MTGKCSNIECVAPISCHEGLESYKNCDFWIKGNANKQEKSKAPLKSIKGTSIPWSGEALAIEELSQISIRNNPVIIGIIGKADAGKTTYLAMLFTLLLRGVKLKEFDFSGTKTIKAWDELYHKLKVQKDNVVFPDPTPAQYLKLLHLAVRNYNGKLKDILLSDASGEVFSIWSQNRDDNNAENARWIYKNADAFILFIDCVDLINRKNSAKTEVIDLAQMLNDNIKDRPVIAVWSKSDKKNEIHKTIKESLQDELKNIFINYNELDISNFSSDDPDILVHKNNIGVLDWLLQRIFYDRTSIISKEESNVEGDIFLNYKGK